MKEKHAGEDLQELWKYFVITSISENRSERIKGWKLSLT